MVNGTVSYYVLDEHTLGYIDSRQPDVFGILHGSVLRGSPYDWRYGFTILAPGAKLRPATLDDFDAFNVSARGHLIPVVELEAEEEEVA